MNIKQVSEQDIKKLFEMVQEIGEIHDLEFSDHFSARNYKLYTDLSPLFAALDWVRVATKYGKLDVEACRREMRKLRKLIDSRDEDGAKE